VWLAYQATKKNQSGGDCLPRTLGCQFSYLENRCDLLLHPTLPESEVSEAASALLTACSKAYDDFELEEIPVIAEEMATHVLYKLGAEFLRHYCQESGSKTDILGSTDMSTVSTQNYWRAWKSRSYNLHS